MREAVAEAVDADIEDETLGSLQDDVRYLVIVELHVLLSCCPAWDSWVGGVRGVEGKDWGGGNCDMRYFEARVFVPDIARIILWRSMDERCGVVFVSPAHIP